MNARALQVTINTHVRGMWKLWLVVLLGKIAAKRGVQVEVEIETVTR